MAMILLLLSASLSWSPAVHNNLAKTPPRGWRSWIALVHEADQAAMQASMDALHKQRPLGPGGALVSLQDRGYTDVGLDGGWARCEGVNGSYHDAEGNLLVNSSKFPSFSAMNAHAHALNFTSSWYLNCDQCVKDEMLNQSRITNDWYMRDAMEAAALAFDGVKFDTQPGGPNWNITLWAEALAATARPMVVEDCLDKHPDGAPLKKSTHASIDILHHPETCPFSFYRTGGDNSPRFLTGMSHVLVEMEPFLNVSTPVPASRPACWAYPGEASAFPVYVRRILALTRTPFPAFPSARHAGHRSWRDAEGLAGQGLPCADPSGGANALRAVGDRVQPTHPVL